MMGAGDGGGYSRGRVFQTEANTVHIGARLCSANPHLVACVSDPVSAPASGFGAATGASGDYYDSGWEAACQEFSDLCRRNKRARQAAQGALLPPELAAAVDVGERRRGG